MTFTNVLLIVLVVTGTEGLLFFWFAQGFMTGIIKSHLELEQRVEEIERHLVL